MRVILLGDIDLGRINMLNSIPVFCDSRKICLFIDNSERIISKLLDHLYRRKAYHSKYYIQTLHEHIMSSIDYKYAVNKLANRDNIAKSNYSYTISCSTNSSLTMPKSTDYTSLSLNSECNLLFSNCVYNNWKCLYASLMDFAKSTSQTVSSYRILSTILGIRVPHLLLKLRRNQISRWTKRFDLLSPYLVKQICYT